MTSWVIVVLWLGTTALSGGIAIYRLLCEVVFDAKSYHALIVYSLFIGLPLMLGLQTALGFWLSFLFGRFDLLPSVVLPWLASLAVGVWAWHSLPKRLTKTLVCDSPLKTYIVSQTPSVLLGILVLVTIGYTLLMLSEESRACPVGAVDAWAMWNVKARFLARGEENWLRFLDDDSLMSHLDYPLGLSAMVAAGWEITNSEPYIWPKALNIMMLICGIMTVFACLWLIKGLEAGLIAAVALLACPYWTRLTLHQLADIPLSTYYLISCTLLYISGHRSSTRIRLIQEQRIRPITICFGLAIGLAAWVKNEGLLFMIVSSVVFVGKHLKELGWRNAASEAGSIFIGSVLPLTAVLSIKQIAPHGNDLISNRSLSEIFMLLSDSQRWWLVLSQFWTTIKQAYIYTWTGLLILVICWRSSCRSLTVNSGWMSICLVLFIVLIGIILVYITTPHDLKWHLEMSNDRVIAQVSPIVTLMLCLLLPDGDAFRHNDHTSQ